MTSRAPRHGAAWGRSEVLTKTVVCLMAAFFCMHCAQTFVSQSRATTPAKQVGHLQSESGRNSAVPRASARLMNRIMLKAYDVDAAVKTQGVQGDVQKGGSSPIPVRYAWPQIFRRLQRQNVRPGHLVQRRWLRKGKKDGFVFVPFPAAVRHILPEPDVSTCLIGRREASEKVSKVWQEKLESLPEFSARGQVVAPRDLDPLEPSYDTPLYEPLPEDEELRKWLSEPHALDYHEVRGRPREENLEYANSEQASASLLRQVLAALPPEIVAEDENNELVRHTVVELLKLLWTVHSGTGATELKWQITCSEGGFETESKGAAAEAFFLLAGENIEFIPQIFVDSDRAKATSKLSATQVGRMSGDDWALSNSILGTNLTAALKRIPPGWTALFKGSGWPAVEDENVAVYRLPSSGKRLFMQVEAVDCKPVNLVIPSAEPKGAEKQGAESDQEADLMWLGPVAGLAAAFLAYARRTPPFRFGRQRRKELDGLLRALQRRSESDSYEGGPTSEFGFEQKLWMDFSDAEDAPVVLVIGGQTETGRVVCSKLLTRGFHVVLFQPGNRDASKRSLKMQQQLPQGSVIASTVAEVDISPVYDCALPDDVYDAVAGADKLVICNCDSPEGGISGQSVKNLLSAWQLYRYEFAERQRAFASKVQLFNFRRQTDFDLWELEGSLSQASTDQSYGSQKAGWTRNSQGEALFIGQFWEPYGQALLRSPLLKLNFKRFSGLVVRGYNQAQPAKYTWFLRTRDFEETRIQYEFDFECEASRWHNVRMPFNAFRPRRADGAELPEDLEAAALPMDRGEVVQMGLIVRTGDPDLKAPGGKRIAPWSLALSWVRVFRSQAEPQVIYIGRSEEIDQRKSVMQDELTEEEADEQDWEEAFFMEDADFEEEFRKMQAREAEAAARIDELVSVGPMEESSLAAIQSEDGDSTRVPRGPAQSVLDSGLAYTLVAVNKFNEHPGGRFPVSVRQASLRAPPLTDVTGGLGGISRGDAAELVVSALMEPACVNAELMAGEALPGDKMGDEMGKLSTFQIGSTMQKRVKDYLKQLTPNT